MAAPTTTIKSSLLQNAQQAQPDVVRSIFNITPIAAAGTTQATAAAVGNESPFELVTNNTTTNGIILPVASLIGQEITIYLQLPNSSTRVYPPVGGTIDGGAVNANIFARPRKLVRFIAIDRTGLNWVSSEDRAVSGTFTCNGTTPVVVTNSAVTADSSIIVTLKTVGGTVGDSAPNVRTITPGTGFTIAGIALDTSVYNYRIL